MINIAICDDDTSFCHNLMQHFKTYYDDEINLLNDYFNGTELLDDIQTNHLIYDFVFLDLDMPQMDGIKTGHELRKLVSHQNTIIMFITSYDSNPIPIVDIHPFAYLKKPLNYELLEKKFNIALQQYYDYEKFIILSNYKATLRLGARDILYAETCGRHSLIHTPQETIDFNMRLSEVEQKLSEQSTLFVRTHSSYLINMRYISKVTPSDISLKDNTIIPLSRTFRARFLEKFNEIYIH